MNKGRELDSVSSATVYGSSGHSSSSGSTRSTRHLPRFSLRRFFCRRPSFRSRSSTTSRHTVDLNDTRSLASLGKCFHLEILLFTIKLLNSYSCIISYLRVSYLNPCISIKVLKNLIFLLGYICKHS